MIRAAGNAARASRGTATRSGRPHPRDRARALRLPLVPPRRRLRLAGGSGRVRARDPAPTVPPKASASRVCCSMVWALAEPVAGLPLAERLTERTRPAAASRSRRGSTKKSAPMLAGSSCTQTTSRAWGGARAGGQLRGPGRGRAARGGRSPSRRPAAARARARSSWPILPVQRRTRSAVLAPRWSSSTVRKRSRAELLERRGGVLVAQHALRRHHDQRLAPGAQHLAAQQVEVLRRGGRLADLDVVLGGRAGGSARGARSSAPAPAPRSRGAGAAPGRRAGPTCPRRR